MWGRTLSTTFDDTVQPPQSKMINFVGVYPFTASLIDQPTAFPRCVNSSISIFLRHCSFTWCHIWFWLFVGHSCVLLLSRWRHRYRYMCACVLWHILWIYRIVCVNIELWTLSLCVCVCVSKCRLDCRVAIRHTLAVCDAVWWHWFAHWWWNWKCVFDLY